LCPADPSIECTQVNQVNVNQVKVNQVNEKKSLRFTSVQVGKT